MDTRLLVVGFSVSLRVVMYGVERKFRRTRWTNSALSAIRYGATIVGRLLSILFIMERLKECQDRCLISAKHTYHEGVSAGYEGVAHQS